MSLFSAVEMAPRDPILGLNEAFNADQRASKVNLGVKRIAGAAPGRGTTAKGKAGGKVAAK